MLVGEAPGDASSQQLQQGVFSIKLDLQVEKNNISKAGPGPDHCNGKWYMLMITACVTKSA